MGREVLRVGGVWMWVQVGRRRPDGGNKGTKTCMDDGEKGLSVRCNILNILI